MSKKLWKVRTNYLKLDTESENKSSKVSEVRLFEAIDYGDAQTQAIKLINSRGCMGECELDISKVSYDDVFYKHTEEVQLKDVNKIKDEININNEMYFYEVKITQLVINDKDEEKYITKKFIVEGEDLEDALDVTRSHLSNEDEDSWWFTSIGETPIEEVILLKLNID